REVVGIPVVALGGVPARPVALLARAVEVVERGPHRGEAGAIERERELVGEDRLAGGVGAVDAEQRAALAVMVGELAHERLEQLAARGRDSRPRRGHDRSLVSLAGMDTGPASAAPHSGTVGATIADWYAAGHRDLLWRRPGFPA